MKYQPGKDRGERSRPRLPVTEVDGIYGQAPKFRDEAKNDLRLAPGSSVHQAGADALPK